MAISPAVAPIVGGLMQHYFGWRSSFILLLVISACVLTLTYYKIEETNKNLNPKATNPINLIRSYKEMLTSRAYLGYTLAISFAWCVYFSFISSSSFIFQDIIGVSPVTYGVIFAVVSLGYVLGTIFARKYSTKFHIDTLICTATLFCFLGSSIIFLFAMLHIVTISVILMPVILIMFGIGIIFPLTQIGMLDVFPKMVGVASGLFLYRNYVWSVSWSSCRRN